LKVAIDRILRPRRHQQNIEQDGTSMALWKLLVAPNIAG
jgi:hypothetical protein